MTGIKKRSGNTKVGHSGYYGVGWLAHVGKWRVQIRLTNTTKYLGLFEDLTEAARHYDKHAKKHGKVLLNFPPRR